MLVREREGRNCFPLTQQTTGHRSCDEIDLINAQGEWDEWRSASRREFKLYTRLREDKEHLPTLYIRMGL